LPALLYGFDSAPLKSAPGISSDFVVNRLFVKFIHTNNIDIVNYCRAQFKFDLPSTVVEKRSKTFVAKYRSCENVRPLHVNLRNLCHWCCFFFLLFFVLHLAVLFAHCFVSCYDE